MMTIFEYMNETFLSKWFAYFNIKLVTEFQSGESEDGDIYMTH